MQHALRSALRTGPPDRGDEGSAWGRTSLPGEVRAARGSGGLSTDSGFDPFSCTSEVLPSSSVGIPMHAQTCWPHARTCLPDPSLHLPTASPQGGNATERGERLDNPYTGAKTKDNGLGGQAGATDRNVSSPTRDFSFVDALENVLGIDINGDGYKGQGYGLVDGLEAVSRWRGQDLTDPGWGWYLLQVLGCVCRVEAVCAVSRSGNVRKGERRKRMALMRWCNSGQVTGLDIDGDGESGAGLGKILEEVTGLDLNGLCVYIGFVCACSIRLHKAL